MGFLFKKAKHRQNLRDLEAALDLREKTLSAAEAALSQQQKSLMDQENQILERAAESARREHELSNRETALNQLQNRLNARQRQIDSQQIAAKAAAVELEGLLAEIQSRREELGALVDLPPLSPTFNYGLFSGIPLAEAVWHCDYENNSRLHAALKERITFSGKLFGRFLALSPSGHSYTVTLTGCTCPDFQFRKIPCKHMYALAVQFGWLAHSREEQIREQLSVLEKEQTRNSKALAHLQTERERMDSERRKLDEAHKTLDSQKSDFQRLMLDAPMTFPWLSEAIADYQVLQDKESAKELRQRHPPARRAADQVRRLAKEKRDLLIEYKTSQYRLHMYEAAAPWLSDLEASAVELKQELVEQASASTDEYDQLRAWLSHEEYTNLSDVERDQLAFDRWYKRRSKSNWEVGREYERYIGYLYEMKGYRVIYYGAMNGFADLGRDLIAKRGNDVVIVQCKRWAREKVIHEKHVFQLYGSSIDYSIRHPEDNVVGMLFSTCPLSDMAKEYAAQLGISYDTTIAYDSDYPKIKCNISRTGRKIYHLPFDQQYDRVQIDMQKGEFYASTVQEAADAGFRHAFRWRGT